MEKLQTTLADWRELKVTMVPLDALVTDEALQPRTPEAVAFKYRHRLTEASELHVTRLGDDLGTTPDRHHDPLLIAVIEGEMRVVDGHHRLEAYRKAGRSEVPARLKAIDQQTAVMVSKLVNCDGVKLPLHPDQAREAAWQFIAEATARGRKPLGASLRATGAAFGVGKSTIDAMVKKVPTVNLGHFGPEAVDPGTGWPRWRYVRGNAWRDAEAAFSPDALLKARSKRLAVKLGKLFDKEGPEAVRGAIAILQADRQDEVGDQLADWIDAETDANGNLDRDY